MRFISKSLRNLSRLRLRSCGGMRSRILLRAANVKAAQQPILAPSSGRNSACTKYALQYLQFCTDLFTIF